MSDIDDGSSIEVPGSGTATYVLKNIGGVFSCSCPAWRYQNMPVEARTCKHLREFRGDAAEDARVAAFGGAAKSQATAKPPAGVSSTAAAAPAAKKGKAPPLLLAHRWDSSVPIKGWWMSEKLDGMRAYWDGTAFFSRLGNPIYAPDWFCAGLPDFALDGELWIARKKFQETVSIVRRQDKSGDWKQVTYQVFDAPGVSGPFEDRVEAARQAFAKHTPPYAVVLPQVVCAGGITELRSELDRVMALGGEGLMMRKPGSQYVAGRSNTLLKVKSFFDAEAKVTGHEPGKGKHKGRLGALNCELPDGTPFHVGTGFSDPQRENPPAIGSIVTFRYQELTKDGVPRFPSFVGERHDVSWPTPWPPPALKAVPDAAASPIAAKPASASPHAVASAPAAAPVAAPTPVPAPVAAPTPVPAPVAAPTPVPAAVAPPTPAPAPAPEAPAPAAAPEAPAPAAVPVSAAPAGTASGPAAEPIIGAPPPQMTFIVPDSPEPAGTPGYRRHFEAMAKFWEIEVRGSEVWTRFGRVGSHGQPRCKSFKDETRAMQWAEEQAAKKMAIGFVET